MQKSYKKELLQPGGMYHIYNHATNKELLFRKDDNYLYFLKRYAHYINPIAETFAYCLMPNHFHFLVRIKDEAELTNLQGFQNLEGLVSQKFSNFFNSYTKAYNKMYDRRGNLFLVNFKRKRVTDEAYRNKLIHYIHYNPVKDGFVEDLRDWKYSSYEAFFSSKATSLSKEQVVEWFDDLDNFIYCHKNDINGFEPEI